LNASTSGNQLTLSCETTKDHISWKDRTQRVSSLECSQKWRWLSETLLLWKDQLVHHAV